MSKNQRVPPDDEENYGLPADKWQPIDTPPIVPGVPPAMPGVTVPNNRYLSGSIPQQFQFTGDLANTQYGSSVPSVRLMPVQGGATVNAATSSVTKPIADTANAAQTTANSASKTASSAQTSANTANSGVATVNSKTAIAVVSGTMQQVTIASLGTATSTPTLDALTDGATYGRVIQTALTSGAIDSTKAGFLAKGGSTVPQIVGSTAALFSYTSTTTTITISWSGFTVYYADGTTATIAGGSEGPITGLTASSTYYFYTYLNGSNAVQFVATTGGVGTPAILYKPQSPLAAQAINLQGVTALSNGGVAATTPASGSGGGSGGGSGLCVRSTMLVASRDRGVLPIGDVTVGDFILGRDGWTQVVAHKVVPQNQFIRVTTTSGAVQITPTHHITTADGRSVDAARVALLDILIAREGYAAIKKIELVETDAHKVVLTCEPEHTFFAGEVSPAILVSNAVPIS
jgi:hypothetical protein